MPAQLERGHFDVLNRIAPADGEHFVHLRRQMIADLLDQSGVNRAELAALQREIDCRRAVTASPQQSMAALLELLEARVADLRRLAERLDELGDAAA